MQVIGAQENIRAASLQGNSGEYSNALMVETDPVAYLLKESPFATSRKHFGFKCVAFNEDQCAVLGESLVHMEFECCSFEDLENWYRQNGAFSQTPLHLEFRCQLPTMQHMKEAVSRGFVNHLHLKNFHLSESDLEDLKDLCVAAGECGWKILQSTQLEKKLEDSSDSDSVFNKVLVLGNGHDNGIDVVADGKGAKAVWQICVAAAEGDVSSLTEEIASKVPNNAPDSGGLTEQKELPSQHAPDSNGGTLTTSDGGLRFYPAEHKHTFTASGDENPTTYAWVYGKWVPTRKYKHDIHPCHVCKGTLTRSLAPDGTGQAKYCKNHSKNPADGEVPFPEDYFRNGQD